MPACNRSHRVFARCSLLLLLALVAWHGGLAPVHAGAQTPEEAGLAIAEDARAREEGFGDFTATQVMVLRNRQGQESRRELRVEVLEVPDDGDKTLFVFDDPRDIRGTAFLVHSHREGANDQWIYLPATRRVRRISSANQSGSFMGSEFAYEDLSQPVVEKFTYRYLRDEPCGDQSGPHTQPRRPLPVPRGAPAPVGRGSVRKAEVGSPAMSSQGAASPRLAWSCVLCAVAALALAAPAADREWLAGDSHIHSHWSTGYDYRSVPPTPIKGRDALYSTPRNAAMARRFGLRWMVTTDHGGPYHSKVNLEQAYRELTLSRELVPEVLQFYGMELNMPGMDHHTLIIPRAEDEASVLHEIESRFDANEDWALPPDPRRRSAALRRQALAHMQGLERLPILFANHPSRSAQAMGRYGRDEPWEFRENNDVAPDVYRGMEGAPGHQAATLSPTSRSRYRGAYSNPIFIEVE